MKRIEIIYSTNIMDLEKKVNQNISENNNDDITDVKLTVGFLGFYCVVMKETDQEILLGGGRILPNSY